MKIKLLIALILAIMFTACNEDPAKSSEDADLLNFKEQFYQATGFDPNGSSKLYVQIQNMNDAEDEDVVVGRVMLRFRSPDKLIADISGLNVVVPKGKAGSPTSFLSCDENGKAELEAGKIYDEYLVSESSDRKNNKYHFNHFVYSTDGKLLASSSNQLVCRGESRAYFTQVGEILVAAP